MDTHINLNLRLEVVDWKDKITSEKSSYRDHGCKLLTQESIDFFKSNNLHPHIGLLWTWPKVKHNLHVWHTDKYNEVDGPNVSINLLLDGDAGITEFQDVKNLRLLSGLSVDETYLTAHTSYFGMVPPIATNVIRKDVPTLMRTDIPHRVNTASIEKTRVTYSIRSLRNGKQLSYPDAWEIFKKYELK